MDLRLRKEFLLCKCDQTFLSSIRSESGSQMEREGREREGGSNNRNKKRKKEARESFGIEDILNPGIDSAESSSSSLASMYIMLLLITL